MQATAGGVHAAADGNSPYAVIAPSNTLSKVATKATSQFLHSLLKHLLCAVLSPETFKRSACQCDKSAARGHLVPEGRGECID